MTYARIIGSGGYLPEKKITNHDLEQTVNTSDDWITQRTGIASRYIVDGESTVSMGVQAAKIAMEQAHVTPEQIDLTIFATSTPNNYMPSCACMVQQALGMKTGPAFDINAACSGFVYAMSMANLWVTSGQVHTALLIGSDAMSRIIDWQDRNTCVLFGDGAGAVVLRADHQPGILSTKIQACGADAALLRAPNTLFGQEKPYVTMQGPALYRKAIEALSQVVAEILAEHGLTGEAIDWLIPHQANLRIIRAVADKLQLPMDKVIQTVKDHANTSAASIPLALYHAITTGTIKKDQRILMEAFGAGLTWGAVLLHL